MNNINTLVTVVFVIVGLWAITNAVELSGPNVCSKKVRSTEYINVNVTYRCLERRWFPASECRWSRRSGCYKNVRTTCWEIQRLCETTWKDVYFCCEGYEENGQGGCQKSIKCEKNNGGCEQKCTTQGNDMTCGCYEGYSMDTRFTCMDVDECMINKGGCDHSCVNTEGSYYCACQRGYTLVDHHTCKEIDECQMGNGMCEHECHNVPGGHYCTCKPGFKLVDGFMCEDIDECSGMTKCEVCVNDYGSFHCVCPEGKLLDKDNVTCRDVGTPPPTSDPFVPTFGVTERLVGPSAAEQCDKIPVGAIVGGIIGGMLLLALLALLLFVLYRRGCFAGILAGAAKKEKSKPSAPMCDNVYDNLDEIQKIKGVGAFDNATYAGSVGVVAGGKMVPPEGHYDNTQANPLPLKPEPTVYDNIA